MHFSANPQGVKHFILEEKWVQLKLLITKGLILSNFSSFICLHQMDYNLERKLINVVKNTQFWLEMDEDIVFMI